MMVTLCALVVLASPPLPPSATWRRMLWKYGVTFSSPASDGGVTDGADDDPLMALEGAVGVPHADEDELGSSAAPQVS